MLPHCFQKRSIRSPLRIQILIPIASAMYSATAFALCPLPSESGITATSGLPACFMADLFLIFALPNVCALLKITQILCFFQICTNADEVPNVSNTKQSVRIYIKRIKIMSKILDLHIPIEEPLIFIEDKFIDIYCTIILCDLIFPFIYSYSCS